MQFQIAVVVGGHRAAEDAYMTSQVGDRSLTVDDDPGDSNSEGVQFTAAASDISSARAGMLAECEREAILSALQESSGNRSRAAAILNIGVATLYRKLKRYGLNRPANRQPTSSK